MIKGFSPPIRTVFVCRSGLLGDTLVTIPALNRIRRCYPEAWIVYVGERVRGKSYVDPAAVLSGTGLVDEFIYFFSGGFHLTGLISLLRLAHATLKRQPQLVIVLEAKDRYTRKPFFFKLLGRFVLPNEGFLGLKALRRLPDRTPYVKPIAVQLDEITREVDDISIESFSTLLPVPPIARARVSSWLLSTMPANASTILFGLGVWSNMQSKRWPLERYIEVVHRLIRRYPELFPIVVGGPEEQGLGADLVRQWGRGAVAAGQFTVQESAALLARCSFYLGNDTGTMHLAAAVGVPCVAIFSARDQAGKWYPYGSDQNIVLRSKVACELCMLRSCVEHQLRCLTMISVDDVVRACEAIIAKRPLFPPGTIS